MLGNYFTLVHISRFIHQQCSGYTISELYSQHKQQLCITVESQPVQTILVSCMPSENYVSVREGSFRARKNSVDLFPKAVGKKILAVTCATTDRIVSIALDGNMSLKCEMFGSRANVLLLEEENTIPVSSDIVVDAFLKKKDLLGSRHARTDPQQLPAIHAMMRDERLFFDALRSSGGEGVFQSLKKVIPVLGATLAKEILLRADIRPSASMSLATDRELKKILAETSKIIAEVTSPIANGQTKIYYEDDAPVCLSLISLRGYVENRSESFPNIAVAIQRFVSTVRASSAFVSEKEQISAWLENEEKKAAQTRVKIVAELANQDRRADYELFGKLIMANLYELRKGLKTVTLEDTLSVNVHPSGVAIPLDPSLSPVANAEKYFKKAKKAKGAFEESVDRVKSLDGRLSTIRMLIGELAEISSSDALGEFHQTYKTQLELLGYATAKEKENLPPFVFSRSKVDFKCLQEKAVKTTTCLRPSMRNRTTCGSTAVAPAAHTLC